MIENILKEGWELLQVEPCISLDLTQIRKSENWLPIKSMPAQVQDVLLEHKKIPEDFLVGWCEKVNWMTEYDWVYRTNFVRPGQYSDRSARIVFKGLDTFADVYLNGQLLIRHENFYLPDEACVDGLLEDKNELVIHFHRISDILDAKPYPDSWKGNISDVKRLRKPVHDFDPHNKWGAEYQGAVPYFQALGVYRDIAVEYYGKNEIMEYDVKSYADVNFDGYVDVELQGICDTDKIMVVCRITDQIGTVVAEERVVPKVSGRKWSL